MAQPPIYSRTDWGSQFPSIYPSPSLGKNLPYVYLHTFAANFTKTGLEDSVKHLRSVESYHVNSRGFRGVGYSFCIDIAGRIYEARGLRTVGAHTQGHNSDAYGIGFFGHGDQAPLSQAQIDAAQALITWLVQDDYLSENYSAHGHREVAAKTCPGNLVYPLVTSGIFSNLGAKVPEPTPVPTEPIAESVEKDSAEMVLLRYLGRIPQESYAYWKGELAAKYDLAVAAIAESTEAQMLKGEDGTWVAKLAIHFGVGDHYRNSDIVEFMNQGILDRDAVIRLFASASSSTVVHSSGIDLDDVMTEIANRILD